MTTRNPYFWGFSLGIPEHAEKKAPDNPVPGERLLETEPGNLVFVGARFGAPVIITLVSSMFPNRLFGSFICRYRVDANIVSPFYIKSDTFECFRNARYNRLNPCMSAAIRFWIVPLTGF